MGVRIEVQSLWVDEGRATYVYEFDQSRINIGRARSADVQLPHAAVSSTHASIRTDGAGYVLVDEDSTNGSRVNEAPLVALRPKPIRSADRIDVGGYRLVVHLGVPVSEPVSARHTALYAEEMLREQHAGEPNETLEARLLAVHTGADESIELLPIAKDTPTEPPPPRASRPSMPSSVPPRPRLGTSELMVYSMAGLLLAASMLVMFLLTRS